MTRDILQSIAALVGANLDQEQYERTTCNLCCKNPIEGIVYGSRFGKEQAWLNCTTCGQGFAARHGMKWLSFLRKNDES